MPLNETSGNVTADAYGGGVAVLPKYIEDYFSTFLYTGTNASKTITNNIDLSTKGGLVWIKDRTNANDHLLYDTVRGAGSLLSSDSTGAAISYSTAYDLASFTTSGFTLGANGYGANVSSANEVSWSFAKAPKFFDVVTYTGNGTNGRTVAHNLGSVPGCMLIKNTSTSGYSWLVYHTSLGNAQALFLDQTDAAFASTAWYSTTPTSTNFTLNNTGVNLNGETYVAYLFASNAGGFGLTGTDNVISCGSYVEGASDVTVNLGYEPQWLLVKPSTLNDTWLIVDNMRGMSYTNTVGLKPQSSAAETNYGASYFQPTATGFIAKPGFYGSGNTIIYIAIRRGPMKVPTDATSVYNGVTRTGTGSAASITTVGFPPDLVIGQGRSGSGHAWEDKLRGNTQNLGSTNTNAESTSASGEDVTGWLNNGITVGVASNSNINASGVSTIGWYMQRAPSFFDEVCYTGDSVNPRSISHNLSVVPEILLIKGRSAASSWYFYTNFTSTAFKWGNLNSASAFASRLYTDASEGLSSQPTSSVFNVDDSSRTNTSGNTYVAYLFASCPNVSKVFTFTGNGTTQTINCGFTGGARFVLLKAQSASGSWYVYDTARGMTVLTDPYLFLNTTAAEVATLGSVTTATTGFAVNEAITTGVNTSGVTYIGLAIA